MLKRLLRPRGRSLATLATLLAAFVLMIVTLVQWAVLRPSSPATVAALLTPFTVCTVSMYIAVRVGIQLRAGNIMHVFRRFQSGELEDDDSELLATDPEFRESRRLFLQLARDLNAASRALAQRDAERRRLFSDVVHEIGTPVSSLLGLAEALERPGLMDDPEMRARVARALAHESERLARFVEDLRDIANLDDPSMVLHREPVDLAALVGEVVERLNTIPNTSAVEVSTAPARVSADPSRLEQIVVNLVTNARRYASAPAPIRVGVKTAGTLATIVVEDGGPGVADADLPKLGERMRRLDKSRTRKTGGTGLGLSIVTAIAERHGGTVRYRRSSLGGLAVEVDIAVEC